MSCGKKIKTDTMGIPNKKSYSILQVENHSSQK
jgi:hypothetical protein